MSARKTIVAASALLAALAVAACMLLAASVPAHAEPSVGEAGQAQMQAGGDAQATTAVSVYLDGLRISKHTPDLAASLAELGSVGSLQASFMGGKGPYTAAWTRTVDGAADPSFSDEGQLADATAPAEHVFGSGELAEGHDYVYTLTLTEAGGDSEQVSIRVLCDDDYGYRDGTEVPNDPDHPLFFHDEVTGADIKVSGYLHRSAHIVVTPVGSFDPAYLALQSQAAGAPITGAWEVAIVFDDGSDIPEDVEPYVGTIDISVRYQASGPARIAAPAANVAGLNATVRVGETWSFPAGVVFLSPDGLATTPDWTIDDARTWLSFETGVLGAFAALGDVVPGTAHVVTLDLGEGGAIVPEPGASGTYPVADGGTLSFVLEPGEGYEIGEVTASDSVPVSVSGNQVSLGPVDADCTLSVAFKRVEPQPGTFHTLTTRVTDGQGTVEPSGQTQVAHGDQVKVTFRPASGWKVTLVLVNGAAVTVFDNAYTIAAMSQDMDVAVMFSPVDSSVGGSGGSGGGGSGGSSGGGGSGGSGSGGAMSKTGDPAGMLLVAACALAAVAAVVVAVAALRRRARRLRAASAEAAGGNPGAGDGQAGSASGSGGGDGPRADGGGARWRA